MTTVPHHEFNEVFFSSLCSLCVAPSSGKQAKGLKVVRAATHKGQHFDDRVRYAVKVIKAAETDGELPTRQDSGEMPSCQGLQNGCELALIGQGFDGACSRRGAKDKDCCRCPHR